MPKHYALRLADLHPVHTYVFVDSAARLATTVVTDDLGKMAYQQSDKTFWILSGVGPTVWTQMGGGGSGYPKLVAAASVSYLGAFYNQSGFASINKVGNQVTLVLSTPIPESKRVVLVGPNEGSPSGNLNSQDSGGSGTNVIVQTADGQVGFSIAVYQTVP